MKASILVTTLVSALLAASGVQAQGMTNDQHSAAKKQIEADYKAAKAQCDTLKANAKDVCEEEAKAKENVAKAELEHQYKPSAKTKREVDEAKAKGAHEVAKERCDDSTGDAKSACKKQADADYDRAKADIKATKY